MSKLKVLSSLFCLIALAYTVTLNVGSNFGTRGKLCENTFFKSIQPWDSTCFYSAAFRTKNQLADLHYEKYRLENFKAKKGVSPHVGWYRSLFLRTYQDVFNYTDDEVDQAHWELMAAAPHKLEYHIDYLGYLTKKQRPAQSALDRYCKMYFKNSEKLLDIAAYLHFLIQEEGIDVDESTCVMYANQNRLDSVLLSDLKNRQL